MQSVDAPNRLFVALDVDEATRGHLAHLAQALAETTGGRAVPTGNLHMTLCFLGTVDPTAVPELTRALAECAAAAATPLRGSVGQPEGPPGRHRPHLFAAHIHDPDDGPLTALWRCVQAACTRVVGASAQGRLWPHITLVRGRAALCRPTPLAHSPHEHPFVFDRMSLYDSHMGHGGPPSYVPVAAFPLGSNRTS